ncbi:MFS transporter [Nonomuraea turcica]|uniref:MFS transporter n=1 Tax=Nonomuraea sp. G32 TaxID=3067274 RepID=UPI00273AB63C|nr:MFS transporter [Nonomuraea sp. G32]MDP4511049.1 MFS transporter [Nonomuraea sp. G32]
MPAPNLGLLVTGRLLLATGSGAMAAGGGALLTTLEPAHRRQILAGYGMVMACLAASATLVGGLVTTLLTWRLTLVLPALSLAAVPLCLPLARRPGSRLPIGLTGAAVLTVTVSTLLTLMQARTLDLQPVVVLALASMFLLAAATMVRHVRRRPGGFIPWPVVAEGGFWMVVSIGVGVFGGLFAGMYAVPQILAAHGWSVLGIGAALLPGAAVGAVLSRLSGRLRARQPPARRVRLRARRDRRDARAY